MPTSPAYSCPRDDRRLLKAILADLTSPFTRTAPLGEQMIAVGRRCLGLPYVGGILDDKGPETLRLRFAAFDCVTFVETCLALARCLRMGQTDLDAIGGQVRALRYRAGAVDGYASRLHYFSDWIFDGARKKLLADETRHLGGVAAPRTIRFMSGHAIRYPALNHPDTLRQMKTIERRISSRMMWEIPLAAVPSIEDRLQAGDILGIATAIDGLDIVHTGLAVPQKDGCRILHASQKAGQVVLSKERLSAYLNGRRDASGLVVARPRTPIIKRHPA